MVIKSNYKIVFRKLSKLKIGWGVGNTQNMVKLWFWTAHN